jgi:DeoR/GlpR family transcriptional regulator of sugar metabolism
MLETRDSVHVAELSKAFAVSEVTVRSDLSELARQGLVARVRGGVRPLQRGQSELGFEFRLRMEVGPKQAIAKAAAAMVDEGEAIALDSSTTAYYLALELRNKKELVVVTNGLLIAAALAEAPGISVMVTGGMLRLHAMSLVGDLGAEALRTTRISKGFLGARGLAIDGGLMDLNPDEVRIKREMATVCERVIGIVDGTKWHRTALLPFVRTDQVDAIVTDTGAPPEEVEAWRKRDVEIVCVEPAEGAQAAAPPGLRRLSAAYPR